MAKRIAVVERKTKETQVKIEMNIDGVGKYSINTGLPFLDHMLALFAKHGVFDLKVEAKGDFDVDQHHTVEDIGICIGEAIKDALGEKEGVVRYGTAFVPMDEALVMASVDLSGRPYLVFDITGLRKKVKDFDTELIEQFSRALAVNAGLTLHIRKLSGRNTHHIVEALFKALGRALDEATKLDQRISGVPSTKGVL